MFRAIKIIAVAILLSHSTMSNGQAPDSTFYFRNNVVETTISISGFGNKFFQGNYLSTLVSIHQKPELKKIFLGIEGFALKSGSFINDKILIGNSNKGIVAGCGPTIGLLASTGNFLIDTRMNFGVIHISQSSELILPDLFGYLKFSQIQNDWLVYMESTSELIRNSNIFNRLLLGIRYEYPLESIAQASINSTEIKISPSNRKNLQIWLELGIHSININNSWRVGGNIYCGYKYASQHQLDLNQIGFFFIVENKYAKVIQLGYTQEAVFSKNIRPVNNLYLKLEVINFGRCL